MNIEQKNTIEKHFKDRLYSRYGIKGIDSKTLQKEFYKRISILTMDKYKTRLLKQYPDKAKCLYVTSYQNKRIKFIYNHFLQIAKTVVK